MLKYSAGGTQAFSRRHYEYDTRQIVIPVIFICRIGADATELHSYPSYSSSHLFPFISIVEFKPIAFSSAIMQGDVQHSARFRIWFREGIKGVPYYYYEAATTEGRVTKKILKARDQKDADHRLRESGLRPMLIENFKSTKKKKKRKALHTRHIIRNTMAVVSGISLVGGVAAYLIVLDLSSEKGVEFQDLIERGIVNERAESAMNVSAEERPFATGVRKELNDVYPDTFGGITIEHQYLMLVFVKKRKNLTDANLDQITSLIAGAFGRHFDLESCVVLMIHKKKKIAEGQYRRGEETKVYVF